MRTALAAPSLLAASLLGGFWIIASLGLGYESRVLLEHCQTASADPASCHLRIYGR